MGLSLRVQRLRSSKCGATHVACSGRSQLGNEDPAAQRLLEQRYRSTGTRQASPLFQPRLNRGLHDVGLDVVADAGANLGQSSLRRLLLAIDKMHRELR